MFGAKFLDLYTYFARNREDSIYRAGTYTGMVNRSRAGNLYFTNKWYHWRDNIKPRLNGLMGRTIKKLNVEPNLNS